MKIFGILGVIYLTVSYANAQCTPSVTTAGGFRAPAEICSGHLIFEENFDSLDQSTWMHEVTLGGGGNWEFQWYVNDRFNSYTTGGALHIKPSFTADIYGEEFLRSGRVIIPPDQCTHSDWNGCDRQGTPDNIINPIRSAIVTTHNSFHYKFGRLEIRAKMPAGDWLWPALWLMPRYNVYGEWPRSGEIDLMEMRSNRRLYSGDTNVGTGQVGSTLHFGPRWDINGAHTAHYARNQDPGYDVNFQTYTLIWTPTQLQFLVDNQHIGTVDAGNGFWQRAGFDGWAQGLPNPWTGGTVMAPFDQEFYIIMNVAVGGTNGYFSDDFRNEPYYKPWWNTSPRAAADFWEARANWEPTWDMRALTEANHMEIDYVRVYAL